MYKFNNKTIRIDDNDVNQSADYGYFTVLIFGKLIGNSW